MIDKKTIQNEDTRKDYEIVGKRILIEIKQDLKNKKYESALKSLLFLEQTPFQKIYIQTLLVYTYLYLHNIDKAKKHFKEVQNLENITIDNKNFNDLVKEAGNQHILERKYLDLIQNKSSNNEIPSLDIPMKLAFVYNSQGKYEKAARILELFKAQFYSSK